LLPFVEHGFQQCNSTDSHAWINLDISIKENLLTMRLATGPGSTSIGSAQSQLNGLANVQKRLALLYPERHELRISSEETMHILQLKIQLEEIPTTIEKDEEASIEQLF